MKTFKLPNGTELPEIVTLLDGQRRRVIAVTDDPLHAIILEESHPSDVTSRRIDGSCAWGCSLLDIILPPASKKLRAWKPEEVPMGALVRPSLNNKEGFRRFTIIAVCPDSTVYLGNGYCSASGLLDKYEHSPDNGKTWIPCGVEE